MADYIDGYVFPIEVRHLDAYKKVAITIADIWKEHGALAYFEYIIEDPTLEGTRSFSAYLDIKKDETVVFGWVAFKSREARDRIHVLISKDPRMPELTAPLLDSSRIIFDANRMVYGGFQSFI